MKLELVFLTCLFALALGATVHRPPSTHPDLPGKCWIQEHGVAVSPGEVFSRLGECVEYRCLDDFSLRIASCGSVNVVPPCYVSEKDYFKLYPDCCPKVMCP